MNEHERQLKELHWMVKHTKWNVPPIGAMPLSAALMITGGFRIGLPLWWSDEKKIVCAGFDWIEPQAIADGSALVNRMIEPGERERIEWIDINTPVLVFRKVGESA